MPFVLLCLLDCGLQLVVRKGLVGCFHYRIPPRLVEQTEIHDLDAGKVAVAEVPASETCSSAL